MYGHGGLNPVPFVMYLFFPVQDVHGPGLQPSYGEDVPHIIIQFCHLHNGENVIKLYFIVVLSSVLLFF